MLSVLEGPVRIVKHRRLMNNFKLKQEKDSSPGTLNPEPNFPGNGIFVRRYVLCALILLVSALAAYTIGIRLLSQIHYLRAINATLKGHYGLASHALQRASNYQPKDYKIHRQWGNVVQRLGDLSPTAIGAYRLAEKAKNKYHEAFRLNSLDAQSAYGLAWQEDLLEQLYIKINSSAKSNPHNALPYYQLVTRLRPNGIRYRYALARYLDRHKNQDELLKVVRKLTRIYPLAYDKLKKEDFWSAAVKAACRQGLQEAVKENVLPVAAHMALVDIAREDEDWDSAISHLQQALQIQPRNKTEKSYFRLGRLFLKSRDMQAARSYFSKSFYLSRNREKHLERLYRTFKNEDVPNEFIEFYREVQQPFAFSDQSGLLLARTLFDLKQYDRARRTVEHLIADDPTAEEYYWLARIAEKQTDWDRMELAIQKATVLEPENIKYRLMFFGLLKRMKKTDGAERQLDHIIEYSKKPSASLYNEKAMLRMKNKDYGAAVEAWQSAIRLKSDNAVYYASAAEAYLLLGERSMALSYYQKATELDPQNKRYRKRHQEILGIDTAG